MKYIISLIFIFFLIQNANCGPAVYGICQSGCAVVVVACYSAAGFTFGTVTAGAGVPAVILGCNSAFGLCSAKCAAIGLLPLP